ncbi:MAG: hypothetical protein J2P31_14485 [Blastocatellia bacterium]|nr:hypothetical protein [Blastocatellia bacterium]
MPTITLEVPDELSEQIAKIGNRWQEWLKLSLEQPALPARLYRDIISFLTSQPTQQQIAEFRPTPEVADRLQTLLNREAEGEITPAEREELDELERIEHLIVMLKSGSLPYLQGA